MTPLVLVTGANGRMAQVLRPALRERYGGLRLFARRPVADAHESEQVFLGDLGEFEAVSAATSGADAILHLGGIADERAFPAILESNIVGAFNVFEAAREHRVGRVVFASSNHITGFYPSDVTVGVEDPVRPDSYYGVSKVFGEALGRLYHDKWGIEVVSLRIGSMRPEPEDVRQLSTWLSHEDGIQLVIGALEAEPVGYTVIYGVSANRRSWWRLGAEAAVLGYEPRDDAEHYAGRFPAAEANQPGGDDRQGGIYVRPDYTGGYW